MESRLFKRVFGKISSFLYCRGSLTIITGANAPFYESLLNNLLASIFQYETGADVIVWDLGLEEWQLENLKQIAKEKRLVIMRYPEKELPAHYAMKKWNYAFKSYCIFESLKKISTTYAIWLDAGCGLVGPLTAERNILRFYGYYSPYSSTSVREKTHPQLLYHFLINHGGENMLSGGVQGLYLGSWFGKSLISLTNMLAYHEDYLAPAGASLENHRYDQSLLSLCYYTMRGKVPYLARYLYNIRIQLNKK